MNATQELASLLAKHTHSESLYSHPTAPGFFYTEGAKAFFQHAGEGAAWLRDLLASNDELRQGVMSAQRFCSVVLVVCASRSPRAPAALGEGRRSALVTVSEDLGWEYLCDDEHAGMAMPEGVFFGAEMDETDCPLGAWVFYLSKTTDGSNGMVLCLPAELA